MDKEAEERWHVSLAGAFVHSWAGVIPCVCEVERSREEGQMRGRSCSHAPVSHHTPTRWAGCS